MSDGFQGIKGTPDGEYFVRWEASHDPNDLLLPPETFIICDDKSAAWSALEGVCKFEIPDTGIWQPVGLLRSGTDGHNRPSLPFYAPRVPTFWYRYGAKPTMPEIVAYCIQHGPVLFKNTDYRTDVAAIFHDDPGYRVSDLVAKRVSRPQAEYHHQASYCLVEYDPKRAERRRKSVAGAATRREKRERLKAEREKKERELDVLRQDMCLMYEAMVDVVNDIVEDRVYKRFVREVESCGLSAISSRMTHYYQSCDPIGNLRRAVLAWRKMRALYGWPANLADPMTWPSIKKVLREAGRRRKKFNTEADPEANYRTKPYVKNRASFRWLLAEIDKAYPSGKIPAERPEKPKTPAE